MDLHTRVLLDLSQVCATFSMAHIHEVIVCPGLVTGKALHKGEPLSAHSTICSKMGEAYMDVCSKTGPAVALFCNRLLLT